MPGIVNAYLKSTWQTRFLLLNMIASAIIGGAIGGFMVIIGGNYGK